MELTTGLLVLFLATGVTATTIGLLKCLELMRAVKEINDAPFNAPQRQRESHRIANAKTRCGRWILVTEAVVITTCAAAMEPPSVLEEASR